LIKREAKVGPIFLLPVKRHERFKGFIRLIYTKKMSRIANLFGSFQNQQALSILSRFSFGI